MLWFLSLSISLIAALFAILVQQWLQAYPVHGGVFSARDGACLRMFRFQALSNWKVPDVIAVLPVLLQSALVLFLVGLINLLWSLNVTIAVTATVFLGLSLAIFIVIISSWTLVK